MNNKNTSMSLDPVNLEISTVYGVAPLTVGFYLHDPHYNIADLKVWHFGDGKDTGLPSYDLVCNHTYYGPPAGSEYYEIWVDIVKMKSDGTFTIIASSYHYHIYVTEEPKEYSFDLTEAVIYTGNFVGFNLSEKTSTDCLMTYEWGDNMPPWKDTQETHPWHRYDEPKYPAYKGKFFINGYYDARVPFSLSEDLFVLVYSLDVGGIIIVKPMYAPRPSGHPEVLLTNGPLFFQVSVSGLSSNFTALWDFGDDRPNEDASIPGQARHTYITENDYHVKCTLTFHDEDGTPDLTLHTTVIIRNKQPP
jgi:hypothetical protein